MGPLGWLAMGCTSLIVIVVVVGVGGAILFGPTIKKWIAEARPKFEKLAEQSKTNPTRALADGMVQLGGDRFEMVAADDEHKRYTVREKKSGQLITFYWDAKENAPKTVQGDFSAIPADAKASGR
ncbi:hypothetical protein CfE428DRAFT_1064 [Chthoniobacter flavus Ellin428]|uniref:Uncharacterized protein n=3 Tax=Chthoniobacter flavus TaxID=191863 RepID=B4CWM6_9BACT|nr:hypothetical protein CfE428DRAFT_1064 [Chthoniobacter flavus Ellin428]TCO95746.1 hypothetical protein EV701_101437 [Chthoniobacter flavus]